MLPVRRGLLLVGICAAVGCGLDVVGTFESAPIPQEVGLEGGGLPELDASPTGDAGVDTDANANADAADADAAVDAGVDNDAARPDAGVVFVPSNILPVYTLTGASVTFSVDVEIDTTAGTIKIGAAAPVASPDIVQSQTFAVWSVGSFVLGQTATLRVRGGRPLVMVAAGSVVINGYFAAYSEVTLPGDPIRTAGPGGFGPALGPGAGGSGAKPGAADSSGGGGAGSATAGGIGGVKGAVPGGTAGSMTSGAGAALLGGGGGGNGGGFVAGVCGNRGRGGPGGGAVQISAIGKITIGITAGIDVGGAGGAGGCKNNGSDQFSGGGGGGAGGMVVLESVAGIELQAGSAIAASGGGGGEGGDGNGFGERGESGIFPSGTALGGNSNNGGNGGNGGVGNGILTPTSPGPGLSDATGGGGGGAAGRAFFGTRTPAGLVVIGGVVAKRSDYAF